MLRLAIRTKQRYPGIIEKAKGLAQEGHSVEGKMPRVGLCRFGHRIPESRSALFNIVSLTAANTSRIFDVSVACVRLLAESGQHPHEHASVRGRGGRCRGERGRTVDIDSGAPC